MSACGATELLNCNESIHEKLLSQTHTSDMAITYNRQTEVLFAWVAVLQSCTNYEDNHTLKDTSGAPGSIWQAPVTASCVHTEWLCRCCKLLVQPQQVLVVGLVGLTSLLPRKEVDALFNPSSLLFSLQQSLLS